MTTEKLDTDGYRTLKTWGVWELKQHHTNLDSLYLENVPRLYPIKLERVFGPGGDGADHWIAHVWAKTWPEDEKHDLARALAELEQKQS